MFINQALAHQATTTDDFGSMGQMMQWMMGGPVSPFWGWLMFIGMILVNILIIVVLVLLAIWLFKQIKK